VDIGGETPISYCNFNNAPLVGDRFTLPGEAERTVPDTDPLTAAETDISGVSEVVNLTIASRDGAAGRYLLIIQGLQIEPQRDRDVIEVALGPLVAEAGSVTLYMVGAADSRLDPFIANDGETITCDDAGVRGCEGVPAATGAGAVQRGVDGSVLSLTADRSDAGIVLQPGEPIWVPLELRARDDRTWGGYAVMVVGSL
jgi:hydrogenase maturation factor